MVDLGADIGVFPKPQADLNIPPVFGCVQQDDGDTDSGRFEQGRRVVTNVQVGPFDNFGEVFDRFDPYRLPELGELRPDPRMAVTFSFSEGITETKASR